MYKNFDRNFKGILVPESLLPYEPFVLGLSTESKIPTVLLLDAPWVQRYGVAGWLYELERTKVFDRSELVPAVAEAFSVSLARHHRPKGQGTGGRAHLHQGQYPLLSPGYPEAL